MKEDRLNTLRQQDAALRDAIRMEEQELPQMPADLNARVMKKTHPQPLPVREGSGHPVVRRLWPWMAAAASLLILIGVGLTMMPEKQMPQSSPVVAEKVEKKPQQVNHGDSPHDASEAMNQRDCPRDSQPRQIPAQPKKLKHKTVVAEHLIAQAENLSQADHGDSSPDPSHRETYQENRPHDPETLTDSDIPITRPENYHYTPEEIALMKRQAAEAYLKWVELELEIAKYNQEQTAQK
jgi:hypothetical protein